MNSGKHVLVKLPSIDSCGAGFGIYLKDWLPFHLLENNNAYIDIKIKNHMGLEYYIPA